MANYSISLPQVGEVQVTKKRGMKYLRLRIGANGEPKVSAPWYVDKRSVENFLKEREQWILAQQQRTNISSQSYRSGMHIGEDVLLVIRDGQKRNRSFQSNNQLTIFIEGEYSESDLKQKKFIENSIHRCLTTQAENILLPRLLELSEATGLNFHQASVKRLVSRWGSCDSQKNIILNIYLVQLPERLRDYVMLHELNHTRHMNHSKEFWDDMEKLMPSVKLYRKLIKQHRPSIIAK